jgi:HSP20 family molecular chaperone IbpA
MLNKKLSLLLPFMATLSIQATDPFGDDIFKEMMQIQQNMDKMFHRMNQRMQQRSSMLVSPLSISKSTQEAHFVDKGDHYEYITNIPENKENKIDITAKNSIISITAKIIEKHENKTTNSYSSSSAMHMYQQNIPMPKNADEESMNAEYKDKRLVISIKKNKVANKVVPHIQIHTTKNSTDIKHKDLNETNTSHRTQSIDKNSTEYDKHKEI